MLKNPPACPLLGYTEKPRMKHTLKTFLLLGLACAANAKIIAGYDFTLTSGDTTPAPTVVASGATATDIVGMGGASGFSVNTTNGDNTGLAASGTTFGSTAGGSFSAASEFMTGTSLAGAITDNDYITFTVTANVAGSLDLTGFSIDKAINTTFPDRVANEWNVLAKVNGDSSAWSASDALLATSLTTTAPQGLLPFESTFIDLSPTTSFGTKFQGITSVEFRVYMWGANGTAFSNATRIDQVVVEGSVPDAVVSTSAFNLAKFQTSSASSANGSQPAQYGNDGFVTQENRWASSGSGPHWYEVSLAVPMEIGSAHLYSGSTGGAAIANFSLQYYNGSAWVNIPGTSVSGNTLPVLNLMFTSPVTAQRFRLYTTDSSAVIKELALYPPASGGAAVPFGTDLDLNVAKLRQFAYSSVAGTNYPTLAIDGYVSDSSAWASTNAAGPHTFEVHFPQNESVRGIHLYSGFEALPGTQMGTFTVDYWSGTAWVTFSGGSVSGNTQQNLSLWFGAAVSTSKVRVRTTDTKQAVIRELVVFSDNGGSAYPLWTDARQAAPPTQSFLDYEDSYYTIENRQSGQNLSTSASGSVTTTAEPWFQVLLNLGTDTYRLRSKDTGRCFEVSQASTAAGAAIVEGDYSSMPHQRWRLENTGDGTHFRIVNVWSGLVLGLNGTNVVQQASGSEFSKNWKINYKTHYPKKGQASHFHFNFMFQPSWAYNWKFDGENSVSYGQYYPMQWGGLASSTAEILRYQPEWYRRANSTIALGFNEPDLPDQSNITEATAAYQWPRMQRMRLPLAGPVPANYKGGWRVAYEALAAEQGLRSDYMAMHNYGPLGANTGSPATLFSYMETLYGLYGKKILLSEFAVRDFAGDKTTWSRNHNFNWLAEFMWRAESATYLKGWSVFEFGMDNGNPATTDDCPDDSEPTDMTSPRLALHFQNDSSDPGHEDLTECGMLLAGWDNDAVVRDNKPYIIHNRGRYLRLIDNPASGTVTYADVRNRDQTEQFVLKPAASGNKYIEGLTTGRRLSCDGSTVGLAAAGTTGSSVEWQLNEWQHGWFHIDHPSTSKRLRITDSNVIDAPANTTTGDNVRFRFIVPAVKFEAPAEAAGTVLVGYDFNASSSYPTAPTMLSSSVTATSMTSPMPVDFPSTVGDTSGMDATGVAFGSTGELGALGIAVSHATTNSFANAVAGDDYVSFTVTPDAGRTLTLSNISFKATKKHVNSVDEYAVTDAAGNIIGSPVIITNVAGLTGTYDSIVVNLAGTAYQTITAATEFRIYAWGRGTTSTGGTLAAIDKVVLRGTAGPILVGYDFSDGSPQATETLSPHVTASALTSPMGVTFPTNIGDNSGVDAAGLAFGNASTLGCVGISVSAAITSSFSAAVAGDDYVTFTVTPSPEVRLNLSSIRFKASTSATTSVDEYAVTDAAGNLIGSTATITTLGQTTTYQSVSVSLSGSQFQNLTAPTTFRIYAWGRGTTSTGGTLAMIDKVTLHGGIAFNTTPTAIPQSVSTAKNTPKSITLTGSDFEGDSLSYSVASQPANGTLSGTAPNLIYTPNTGYIGTDSFTFTANDGQTTSTAATVSLLVGVATDVLAGYDFDDGNGIATTAATVKGANVTVSDFGVGAGMVIYYTEGANALAEDLDAQGYVLGTANPISFGGGTTTLGFVDMNNADNLALAITENDYMTFTITPDSGHKMDLTSFTFRSRINDVDNSAERWALFSSVGGFTAGSQIAVGRTTVTATYVNYVVDLSAAAFQGLTEPITFRLYIYGGNEPWGGASMYDKLVVHGDVTPVAAEDAYAEWASGHGLTGDNALPGADSENGGAGDGYTNLAEFALGMNPTVWDAGSRESYGTVVEDGKNYFEYMYHRRTDRVSLGLTYQLLDSATLQDFGSSINTQDDVIVGPAVDGYEPVTNRYLMDASPMFLRLQMIQE